VIDDVDAEDPDLIRQVAADNDLLPKKLLLYKRIFDCFDEGDYKCVVTISDITFGDKSLKRLVDFKKGGSLI